jgi:hypothetical protein
MGNFKKVMGGIVAALTLGAPLAAHAEGLGACKVKIAINNKCASTTSVMYVNFWHKSVKNKYSIPILELKDFKGDSTHSYSYDVLVPCSEEKKVEAKYQYPNPKKNAFQQEMGDWKWAEVESGWQKGQNISIDLDKCE